MLRKFLIRGVMLCLVIGLGSMVGADSEKTRRDKEDRKDVIPAIVKETFGKDQLLRVDPIEPSHIEGWKQRRIWVRSPWGERPYLIYILEDKGLYILGSVFDRDTNNMTAMHVGNIKPKTIRESEMNLKEDYRIGSKDAKVRAVLWIGTDVSSKFVYDNIYKVYEKNKDKMSISIKFYPRGESDYNRMKPLTCFKGEEFEQVLKTVLESITTWGSPKDIAALKEKRKITDDSVCEESVIAHDLKMATQFQLPSMPVIFINGTILLEGVTSDQVSKLAGIPLQ